jgi:8-oxo-dGTP diphosphatase
MTLHYHNSRKWSKLDAMNKAESAKAQVRVGVGVILIQEGKVLLGKRKSAHGEGSWSPPGGHLEHLESVKECAARELIEETGLVAQDIELGPWVENVMDGDKHYITLFAFVRAFSGTLQNLEPHKCEGWEWFDLDDLPAPLFPSVKSLLTNV